MSQKALVTELDSMRKYAEQVVQEIDQILNNLSAKRQSLRETVDTYQKKRIELFKNSLKVRRMTWCTNCPAVVPSIEVKLILTEETKMESHGYGNAFYDFRLYLNLHRACPTCYKRFTDKHGWKGTYDSQAKNQPSFYAFDVEERDDGHYTSRFGKWVKLNDDKLFGEPSSGLIEKLADELDLPPQIKFTSGGFNPEDKLIINEQKSVETV